MQLREEQVALAVGAQHALLSLDHRAGVVQSVEIEVDTTATGVDDPGCDAGAGDARVSMDDLFLSSEDVRHDEPLC